MQIDTFNHFMVASRGDKVVILSARTGRLDRELSQEEVLNLAAYLVAMADPAGERFKAVLEAVLST